MGDETPRNQPEEKSRRFRLIRTVKKQPPPPTPAEDDADPGTPEQDRSLREGCTGCLRVTGLIFLIMIASIIGTCAIGAWQK